MNADKQHAISFLKLYNGHKAFTNELLTKKATVSEIQINLQLNGKVSVTSDQSIKNVEVGQLNPDK